MNEEIICGLRIYFLADKAIVPTEANIPAGFTISVEPVEIFDFRDRESFLEALWSAVERGNPDLPDPPAEQIDMDAKGFPMFKYPLELKYSGAETWDDFERMSICASVSSYPSGYIVDVFGRSANGAWSDEVAYNTRVRIEDGLGGVVNSLLKHLESRADLPANRTGT